jgi:hypothetical protein
MRAVCKVHRLTLLFWVGTLWRCSDGLFFAVPSLASDALMTLHPLLKNVLQTFDHLEIACRRAPFSWLGNTRNHVGWDLNWIVFGLEKVDWWNPIRASPYSADLAQCDFWDFPTMKRELWGKKFGSDQWSASCFEKWVECCKKCITCQGRYFKKEAVTAPPQSSDQSNKVSLQTLQMTLVYGKFVWVNYNIVVMSR